MAIGTGTERSGTPRGAAVAAALVLAAAGVGGATPARAEGLERVSVGPRGAQANGSSSNPSISADGRYVAFAAFATDLVAGDTNGVPDIFVRDRRARTTTRVSLGPGGAQADEGAYFPAISANGRFVAFASIAGNLVPGDTNGVPDIFVRDLGARTTTRVSVGPGGVQGDSFSGAPSISADGRFVAFASEAANLVAGDTNGEPDVFVHDRQTRRTTRVSVGPGGAQGRGRAAGPATGASTSISADGRLVAFTSGAANLVPGDTDDRREDVFVHDRRTRRTTKVSVGPGGVAGDQESFRPAISADGRHVAFFSFATNLVPSDTNGLDDVFVRDLAAGRTTRVSVGPGGAQSNGGGDSGSPAISADGRFVAFHLLASNLVPGDTNGQIDVFLHDRRAGVTRRPSLGSGGVQGDGFSGAPALSTDGRFVAFHSGASNLIPGDTNGEYDVYVRTR